MTALAIGPQARPWPAPQRRKALIWLGAVALQSYRLPDLAGRDLLATARDDLVGRFNTLSAGR